MHNKTNLIPSWVTPVCAVVMVALLLLDLSRRAAPIQQLRDDVQNLNATIASLAREQQALRAQLRSAQEQLIAAAAQPRPQANDANEERNTVVEQDQGGPLDGKLVTGRNFLLPPVAYDVDPETIGGSSPLMVRRQPKGSTIF